MKEEKVNVLFVDDELHNLNSFKASFRRDYNIFIASSAQEGLKILEDPENDIQVVLTDQRMPGISGTEFLTTLTETYPDVIRILITAYADIEAVVEAINKGKVFSYVSKPWNQESLKSTIQKAYDTYIQRKRKDEEVNYFVFKASHDIKGPLVSLKGLVDIVKDSLDDQDRLRDMVSLIDQSVLSLENTLNDMIEYKKVDSSELRDSLIDFDALLNEIVSSVSNLPESNDLSITMEVDQSIDFKNDREVIRSIAANIIINAIKYRKPTATNSTVKISLKVYEENAILVVKDNGVGMSEGVLENAFSMFYRGHKGVNGSGLGLYIVKKGLERIGGTIEVESILAEGSTFTVEFPNHKSRILKRENIVPHTVV